MKERICLLIFILSFIPACSYSRFTITGVPYSPLTDDAEIKVVSSGDMSNYDQIGIAEIRNSDKDFRLEEAKKYARMYGGSVVMLEEGDGDSKVESFRVLYPYQAEEPAFDEAEIIEPEIEYAEEFEEPEETEEPKKQIKERPDYSNLPVVPFKILAGELSNLTGEKFRATLYPKKSIATPKALSSFAGKDLLLELNSKKGDNLTYLIIDKKRYELFNKGIKAKKAIRFVYTPVVLYNSRIPVLRFYDFVY